MCAKKVKDRKQNDIQRVFDKMRLSGDVERARFKPSLEERPATVYQVQWTNHSEPLRNEDLRRA